MVRRGAVSARPDRRHSRILAHQQRGSRRRHLQRQLDDHQRYDEHHRRRSAGRVGCDGGLSACAGATALRGGGRLPVQQRVDISVTYTNVQYIPGTNSLFMDEAVFNTAGTVLHWKASPTWDFAAGYSYTWASKANGINDAASYHQFNLSQYYSLSKRTDLYALEAFQRANDNTLAVPSGTTRNPVRRLRMRSSATASRACRRHRAACSRRAWVSSTASNKHARKLKGLKAIRCFPQWQHLKPDASAFGFFRLLDCGAWWHGHCYSIVIDCIGSYHGKA